MNFADGLRRMGGNEELFRMVLQEYYHENKSVAVALEKEMDARDYAAAVQIVHKIKSSSGSIGARKSV